MRITIIVLLVFILIGCRNTDNKNEVHSITRSPQNAFADTFYLCDKLIKIETITESIFENAANGKTIEGQEPGMNKELVHRSGDTLSIVTTKGTSYLIDIHSDNDSASKYDYQYFDTDISQHVILGTFYEWYYYVLIDKNTGDTTYTCGLPVLSPDKKYFICGNADLEASETLNGFQLYRNASPPVLLCERALEKWGPETIKWVNDTSLIVAARILDSTGTKPIYLRLKLD